MIAVNINPQIFIHTQLCNSYVIAILIYSALHFTQVKEDVKKVFTKGEKELKPNPNLIFEDVYSTLPPNLQKQKEQLWSHLSKYQAEYPLDTFEHDKNNLKEN